MHLRSVVEQQALTILLLLSLAGCGSASLTSSTSSVSNGYPALPPAGSGRGGYYMDDGPGDVIPAGLKKMPDAVPKVEPYSRSGNKPYVVLGKRYVPITNDRPFAQEGYGSWYGKKFQGQKTSSGELYDMYKMTAAHPTLPLPSYARVTNLGNGKQVIVRINDRGPFLSSRIIDLSYTAALKLGYVGHGSAKLRVERLLPSDIEKINATKEQSERAQQVQAAAANLASVQSNALTAPQVSALQPAIVSSDMARPAPVRAAQTVSQSAASPLSTAGYYLQFGAYSQMNNAETVRAKLSQDLAALLPPLTVESSNRLYRIFSGPFVSREDAMAAASRAQQVGANKPVIVQR